MPGRVEIALVVGLVGNDQRLGRPADREARIVPAHATLAVRRVEGRDQVQRFDILGQRQKAMRETARHIHHVPVLSAELGAETLAEGGRTGPQIEDRVPQRALDAAHDLDLGRIPQLVVHATQGAAVAAEGIVDLYEMGFQPGFAEFALAKKSREKAALVRALVELDYKGAGERGRHEAHDALTPWRLWLRRAAPADRGGGARGGSRRTGPRRNRAPAKHCPRTAPAAPPCPPPACIRAGNPAATGGACRRRRGNRADPCQPLRCRRSTRPPRGAARYPRCLAPANV